MTNSVIKESHIRCRENAVSTYKRSCEVGGRELTESEKSFVESARTCIKKMSTPFFALYNSFFTLVDSELTVVDCLINKNSNIDMTEYAPELYTSLKEEHFGTSAVSIAYQKKDVGYVVRGEHFCVESKKLLCVATPIWFKGEAIGYLAFSTLNDYSVNSLRVMIESIATNISNFMGIATLKGLIFSQNKLLRESDVKKLDILSEKEKEIAGYVVKGYSTQFMAESMCVAESTVKTHLKNIYLKLGTGSKLETALLMLCREICCQQRV